MTVRPLLSRFTRTYVPRSPAGRAFALVALLDSVGTGFYLAGSTLFFVRVIGLSDAQVGLGLAATGLTAFLATVPLGVLTDRWGARRMLMVYQLWRAVWFAVLAFVHGPIAFVLVSALLGLVERAVSPASQAVVSVAVPGKDRTRTMATMRSVRNIGFSLGAVLTTPLLATGSTAAYRTIVLADAASFVLAVVLLARLRVETAPPPVRRGGLSFLRGFGDRRYLALTAVSCVLAVHMSVLAVALPLWTVRETDAPDALVPVLVVLNTVLAVVFQVPLAKGAEREDGGSRAMRLAGLALIGSCAVFAAAAAPLGAVLACAVLLAATVLLTAGELWHSIGAWELSYKYAPEHRKAEYLSIFALGNSVQDVLGPPLITVVVLGWGGAGWAVLGALLLAAVLVLPLPVARLDRRLLTAKG
ncbi:membrane transport protein [Streptomyces griseoaurantiacus M045]|uniref:Membrane transport protein n=1 Tax=Streptomyces griseoaurantiacus M045 TaxID=996637 RepID=F3NCY2_9ACTN|nr:MFS transporter [Streptomyces griseoaurantiacus]EGG48663.1 membrane transport protein [Streptomyces griseoaurantiacus M045]